MNSKFYEEGQKIALNNGNNKCPYMAGSKEYEEWLDGWADGTFELYLDHSVEYHDGYFVGLLEEEAQNPYPEDSLKWSDWNLGFKEGSEDFLPP